MHENETNVVLAIDALVNVTSHPYISLDYGIKKLPVLL